MPNLLMSLFLTLTVSACPAETESHYLCLVRVLNIVITSVTSVTTAALK